MARKKEGSQWLKQTVRKQLRRCSFHKNNKILTAAAMESTKINRSCIMLHYPMTKRIILILTKHIHRTKAESYLNLGCTLRTITIMLASDQVDIRVTKDLPLLANLVVTPTKEVNIKFQL